MKEFVGFRCAQPNLHLLIERTPGVFNGLLGKILPHRRKP